MKTETGYKYVYHKTNGIGGRTPKRPYQGAFGRNGKPYNCGNFETAREAAIAVDRKSLELGFEAVNILIRREKRIKQKEK